MILILGDRSLRIAAMFHGGTIFYYESFYLLVSLPGVIYGVEALVGDSKYRCEVCSDHFNKNWLHAVGKTACRKSEFCL